MLAFRPSRKSPLDKDAIKFRLAFAKVYRDCPLSFWKKVFFFYETMLRLHPDDSRIRVRRKRGERLNLSHVKSRYHQQGQGILFWGCISWYGVGPLVTIEGNLKSKDYAELLDKAIPQALRMLNLRSSFYLEDNPKVHKTKKVKDIKDKYGLRSLDLPIYSLDLNVIENLWDIWKDRIHKRRPQNVVELKDLAYEKWNNIQPKITQNLIRSMPIRLKKLLEIKVHILNINLSKINKN